MRVLVRVTARASRERLEAADGALRAWVTAPAEHGRANAALLELVARTLELRRGEVALVSGARSREKVLELPDRAAERLRRLAGA